MSPGAKRRTKKLIHSQFALWRGKLRSSPLSFGGRLCEWTRTSLSFMSFCTERRARRPLTSRPQSTKLLSALTIWQMRVGLSIASSCLKPQRDIFSGAAIDRRSLHSPAFLVCPSDRESSQLEAPSHHLGSASFTNPFVNPS